MVDKELVETIEVLLIWAKMFRKDLYERGDFKHKLIQKNINAAEALIGKKKEG